MVAIGNNNNNYNLCNKPVGAVAFLCILVQDASSSNHGFGGSIFSLFLFFIFLLDMYVGMFGLFLFIRFYYG